MRLILPSAALAFGLALSACGPSTVHRGLSSVNQPVVSRSDYVFDARAGGAGLDYGEADRLAGWFDSLKLGYGDHVAIDDPANSGAARDAVGAVTAHYGLLLSTAAPVTETAPAPGTVRIVVTRTTAEVPHCPNWDRLSQPELAASSMSNYGCAVNSNLAAMVADPNDLIEGKAYAGSDPRAAVKAIRTYRDADPTGKLSPVIAAASTTTKGGN